MICVDELMPVIKVIGKWRWPTSCHLYSDDNNISELHDFAQKLGLKLSWFQNDPVLPHYDLTKGMRKRAIELGAKEATIREMVEVMRKNRSKGVNLKQ